MRTESPREPQAVVGQARSAGPDPARHRLLPLPDLLHAGAIAEDRPGGHLRQPAHRPASDPGELRGAVRAEGRDPWLRGLRAPPLLSLPGLAREHARRLRGHGLPDPGGERGRRLFVPLYQVVNRLGLDDNLLALLLIYPTMALPFCIWILSAYFHNLSREIEEAALIEGASRATAFFRIILPMSRPVLVAAGIFTLGTIASDFMIASVFLLSPENQTIPAGLGTVEVALDELAAVAGINLLALPVLVISALFARGYVRGLTASMVEGS
ncbi:MAG: hypothetical protein DME10_24535 [Candidatus Rokuibacteriota bacterium]|nr:MAG: hypothetical protein DME10_24535 [Candidatus Rokubacteria bacterium]